jgi:hypothetical protein
LGNCWSEVCAKADRSSGFVMIAPSASHVQNGMFRE